MYNNNSNSGRAERKEARRRRRRRIRRSTSKSSRTSSAKEKEKVAVTGASVEKYVGIRRNSRRVGFGSVRYEKEREPAPPLLSTLYFYVLLCAMYSVFCTM